MGAKSLYNDNKKKIIKELNLNNDIEAINKLNIDKEAYLKYSKDWKSINLDEFIENNNFKVVDDKYNIISGKRKISFFSNDMKYEIVCAIGASYFRILRLEYFTDSGVKVEKVYVDENLKEPKILPSLKGKDAKYERNRLTHFKMTYRRTKHEDS